MTRSIQIIGIVYLALLVVMCVYVPVDGHYGETVLTSDRTFVWSMGSSERISVGRLVLSIVAVTALAGGAVLVVRLRGSSSGEAGESNVEHTEDE